MRSSKMARSRCFGALVGALYSLLLPGQAVASPGYPPLIQAELGLANPPDCTLCHRDSLGGPGTVVRPFGRLMMSHFQLSGGSNLGALKAALAGDAGEHLDIDSDGVPDLEELRAGSDPNVGASGEQPAVDLPLPETGCALGSGAGRAGASRLLFVALCLLLVRRRRVPGGFSPLTPKHR